MWTLKQLDKPPSGWTQVVEECEKNPAFPNGYQGIKYTNLARLSIPVPKPEPKNNHPAHRVFTASGGFE